jgi:acylphosphatase
MGLRGWVRNRSDGSVEAWAEGSSEQLSRLEAWLRVGSPKSRVDDLLVEEVAPSGDFDGFEVA